MRQVGHLLTFTWLFNSYFLYQNLLIKVSITYFSPSIATNGWILIQTLVSFVENFYRWRTIQYVVHDADSYLVCRVKVFGTPRSADPAEGTETEREDVPENKIVVRWEAVSEVNVKFAGSWTATPVYLFGCLMTLSVTRVSAVSSDWMEINTEEETIWKWSWPHLRLCPGIYLYWLRKNTKTWIFWPKVEPGFSGKQARSVIVYVNLLRNTLYYGR